MPPLISALPEAMARCGDIRVVVAGVHSLGRDPLHHGVGGGERVLELIDRLGLSDRIEVRGFVPEPQEYFRRAKVFVLPADIVFANYALLEAMSFGAVPLVGDGEGADRIVDSTANGLVVERTPSGVADGLVRLLSSPAILQRYSDEARATIKRDFAIERWGEQILAARD